MVAHFIYLLTVSKCHGRNYLRLIYDQHNCSVYLEQYTKCILI